MLKRKNVIDFAKLFSPNNFKKNDDIILNHFLNFKQNFIGTSNLSNQQFRLNKISEIEDYFVKETKERVLMSKKLSKYISFFIYFD